MNAARVFSIFVLLPLAACLSFDPMNTAGHATTAVRVARDVCSAAWAKPVPDESHWGAQLVGDHWRVWLRDHGGTPTCALAMVTVERRSGDASDCRVCPNF
jgi:hypothetical protein